MLEAFSGSATAIDAANIGFQLLKKHGWKEGTGLGAYEQGRLEPLQSHLKNNKRGLGADKPKNKKPKPLQSSVPASPTPPGHSTNKDKDHSRVKVSRALSKKQKKMQELEKHLQEKEFERAFFREFWPDNV